MPDGSVHQSLPPTRPAPLPSIEAIGRHIRRLDAADDLVQGLTPSRPVETLAKRNAGDLVSDRRRALEDLVLTLPARTMADAVVQAAAALAVADNENTDDWKWDARMRHLSLVRALASVLPVLVRASGIPPEDLIEAPRVMRLCEEHFGLVETALAEQVA